MSEYRLARFYGPRCSYYRKLYIATLILTPHSDPRSNSMHTTGMLRR